MKKTLTIATNSNLNKEYIGKHYKDRIEKILKEVTGKKCTFEITVDKNLQKPDEEIKPFEEISSEPQQPFLNPPKSKFDIPLNEFQIDAMRSTSNGLNLKYTFDSFVVGTNNKFAQAAALSVARKPAQNHNPLFIYGGAGLGKTHLMQAIGHYILSNHPDKKVKYTTTEAFTNDLINCLRSGGGNNKMSSFRQKYRQVDVLMIDDIQFIESKTSTQEEIFHTFEDLYAAGKQIIITSDRPPKKIATLTERLRSRFEWGLLTDIQVPDLETRIAILKNKAEADGTDISDEVLELIATAYQNNIRELEGALNRVVAYVSINDCPMSVDSVKSIINFRGATQNLSVNKIIEKTASFYNLESSEIKGARKSKGVSQARQIAIYLTRDMTGMSFPMIGEAFGGRKHTTILYSYEKVKEEMQINKAISESISEISKRITQD